MSDYCDYMLSPLKDKISIASKLYQCCECKTPILKGMAYWLYQGKSDNDGTIETYHQHIECRNACHLISQKDDCLPFGNLREHLFSCEASMSKYDYLRQAFRMFLDGIDAGSINQNDIKYYNFKHLPTEKSSEAKP